MVDREANPPEFIWHAAERRANALENVKDVEDGDADWDIVVEMDALLRKFCELHAV